MVRKAVFANDVSPQPLHGTGRLEYFRITRRQPVLEPRLEVLHETNLTMATQLDVFAQVAILEWGRQGSHPVVLVDDAPGFKFFHRLHEFFISHSWGPKGAKGVHLRKARCGQGGHRGSQAVTRDPK